MTDHITPFGLRDGRLHEPAQVPSGLACNCVCPGCGAALVAKKGNMKRWHFSHHNAVPGENCAESAIHAAAKQVLIDHGSLMVPKFAVGTSARAMDGRELYEYEVLSPVRRIRFDRAVPEETIGDIRPDVVGYSGDRRLIVEMYFRHRVDVVKRAKLVALGIPALEIDLSDLDEEVGFESVTERVINSVVEKEWLVYPRRSEHLAYLEYKLRERIDTANDVYLRDLDRKKAERARLAGLAKTQQVAKVGIDSAFSLWSRDEQEAWLREQLDLKYGIPAFLSRQSYPLTVIRIPAFLLQASIFERYIYNSTLGTKLTVDAVYPCLRRRFELNPQESAAYKFAITLYLEYLVRARFLHREAQPKEEGTYGPYYVEHNDVSLPLWCHPDTQYDGQPLLSPQALGKGRRCDWSARMPRWRAVIEEAHLVLAGSRHRDLLLTALEGMSSMNLPPSPHHWAESLLLEGVTLEECLDLLSAAGLIAD